MTESSTGTLQPKEHSTLYTAPFSSGNTNGTISTAFTETYTPENGSFPNVNSTAEILQSTTIEFLDRDIIIGCSVGGGVLCIVLLVALVVALKSRRRTTQSRSPEIRKSDSTKQKEIYKELVEKPLENAAHHTTHVDGLISTKSADISATTQNTSAGESVQEETPVHYANVTPDGQALGLHDQQAGYICVYSDEKMAALKARPSTGSAPRYANEGRVFYANEVDGQDNRPMSVQGAYMYVDKTELSKRSDLPKSPRQPNKGGANNAHEGDGQEGRPTSVQETYIYVSNSDPSQSDGLRDGGGARNSTDNIYENAKDAETVYENL